ncbi:MAG TPA: type II toxin-antitoxin system VapC family toxin [Anaerolineae bacterium]|nr:type II toxin-antitoxin system VapC family toxin [Anaerolineae bacterium]
MKYLLDTNICIELIRRQPTSVMKRLTSLRVGDAGISSVTVAELYHGVYKSQNPEQNLEALEQFLLPLAIAEFGSEAAIAYGQIRADLERKGTPIGSMDLLIAAHAVSLNVVLVTNNLREFTRVPKLQIEDWTRK